MNGAFLVPLDPENNSKDFNSKHVKIKLEWDLDYIFTEEVEGNIDPTYAREDNFAVHHFAVLNPEMEVFKYIHTFKPNFTLVIESGNQSFARWVAWRF